MNPIIERILIQNLKQAYDKLGYPLFTSGDLNLNIFGIRSSDKDSNSFNDIVGMMYKENSKWVIKCYDATTDPGIHYRENPMNSKGCAILAPGFYRGGFRIGKHQGKYDALVMNSTMKIYRDNNKDAKLDFVNVSPESGVGINIHRASNNPGGKSTVVDKWSAGCQVIASYNDFDEFMSIVKKSSSMYGSVFSYALLKEEELIA